MSNYIKIAAVLSTLVLTQVATAQPANSCTNQQRYVDSVERCVDIKSTDVIALGTLRVEEGKDGNAKVVLHDETRGDIDLILTPSLVDAVDESPADSYEVEGFLHNGELTVKNLRPIE
jgi:hypothetical protein